MTLVFSPIVPVPLPSTSELALPPRGFSLGLRSEFGQSGDTGLRCRCGPGPLLCPGGSTPSPQSERPAESCGCSACACSGPTEVLIHVTEEF